MFKKFKMLAKSILRPGDQDDPFLTLSPEESELISRIRGRNLTYLSSAKLKCLVDTCRSVEERGIEGDFIEAGCALGGSAVLIAHVKADTRSFNVYDVFGMIPPPAEEDTKDVHDRYRTIVEGNSKGIGGDQYYGYIRNLHDVVKGNLEEFGFDCESNSIALIVGLVQDTLLLKNAVAFAHVDVDWYDPVRTCLERIWPRLAVGGSVVVDDYHDWGGCRKATDEFLRGCVGEFELDDTAGSMKVTRINSYQSVAPESVNDAAC